MGKQKKNYQHLIKGLTNITIEKKSSKHENINRQ